MTASEIILEFTEDKANRAPAPSHSTLTPREALARRFDET